MSRLASSSDTVKKLGLTGIGTDAIGYKVLLFHQLNARILNIKIANGGTGGSIYIEGDVTDFISGYTYFWINKRSMKDVNIFEKTSATYDSTKYWTELVVEATDYGGGSFTAKINDIGGNICGLYDATSLIKDFGNITMQLTEEGSLGNASVGKFNFSMNDEDKVFYDKVNRSGLFYNKEVIAEVKSIDSIANYSFASGVYETWFTLKNLGNFTANDFINGYIEFLSGDVIGGRALILDGNGLSVKVIGNFSNDYKNVKEYRLEVKEDDKIRLNSSQVFICRVDMWHRDHISEKLTVFTGKVDLSVVDFDDDTRCVSVECYDTIKDLMNKSIADLNFDMDLNLPRLREVKALMIDKCINKVPKILERIEVDPNPLDTVKVMQVGFDVSEGWHILDFSPDGILFRFDFGKWYQAKDEDSFEQTTNQIFLASNENKGKYDRYAVLPDHTIESNTIENNVEIERKWHGGWVGITIDTEESFYIGSVNGQKLGDRTPIPKKFSGLPKEPFSLLFHVDKDHKVDIQNIYSYRFDNGQDVIPNLFFDYVHDESEVADETFGANIGSVLDRKSSVTGIWGSINPLTPKAIDFYCFKKFNGVMLQFRELTAGYNALLLRSIQQASIRYSVGNKGVDPFWKSLNSKYVGGYAVTNGTNLYFRMETYDGIYSDSHYGIFSDLYEALEGMRLLCISGENALLTREIRSVAQVVGDISQINITVKQAWPNAVSINDRFLIINKDNDVRFLDIGEGFKDGEQPDVLSLESNDLSSGTFYDIRLNKMDQALYTGLIVKPGEFIHIGHRSKFNCFTFGVDIDTTSNNDYSDIAWYLRRDFISIEYWNGAEWKSARNVSLIPTSVINIKDTAHGLAETIIYDDDDLIKYKVYFNADDWNTGSYDNSAYDSEGAPSDIDENSIYMIRISLALSMPVYLKYVSLSLSNDLHLAVMWNNIKSWGKNKVRVGSGKYIVETLTTDVLVQDLYGIQIYVPDTSYRTLLMARPITKLTGSLGQDFYFAVDVPNIDVNEEKDIIYYNPKQLGNIGQIPVNFNQRYLLERLFQDNDRIVSNHLDSYNNFGKQLVNIVGTKYDGVYPIGVGWDAAFMNKNFADYTLGYTNHKHICVVKHRDETTDSNYIAYSVNANRTEIHRLVSNDMTTWASNLNIVANIGNYKILAVDVVKNKDDTYWAFYITARDTAGDNKYNLYVYYTTNNLVIDMNNITKIIDIPGKNIGVVSVLHIKGVTDDSADCRRIAWVTVYSDDTLSTDDPAGTPSLYFYESIDKHVAETWLHDDGHGNTYDEKAGLQNPAFVKANYAEHVGNDADNTYNMYFEVICTKYESSKYVLYKLYGPYQNNELPIEWGGPILVGPAATDFLTGFSAIKDTGIYSYRDETGSDAFTMIPATTDAIIIFGVTVGGVTCSVRAVNLQVTDWDDDYMKSMVTEFNELDWFKNDQSSVVLKKSATFDIDLYLGFRKKFNKVEAFPCGVKFSDRLQVQYWDGTTWQDFDTVYQLNRTITDSKICPLFGFHWDVPTDWAPDDMEDIFSSVLNSSSKQQSLYWVKLTLPSSYADDATLTIKGFKLCWTNVWLTMGRNLYMMENWNYIKSVYTFPHEANKKLVIDDIVYDKEDKNVIVNLVDDNPYEYRKMESYIFDVFGNIKNMTPIWDKSDQHFICRDRPTSIFRVGYDNSVDAITMNSISMPMKVMTIGAWSEAYIETLYNDGTFSGYPIIGYNVPIPKPQLVRKYSPVSLDWEKTDEYWSAEFINNVYLAKALSEVDSDYSNIDDYIFNALTNCGLLQEELVNGPVVKLFPGYYGALERSFQELSRKYDVLIKEVVGSLPTSPIDGCSYLASQYADSDWASNITYKVNQIMTYRDLGSGKYAWAFSTPKYGMVIYVESEDTYYWWDDKVWREYSDTIIWPGRIDTNHMQGIGLEFTMGQEGVKIPYFRPYNCKPERFLNNNVNQYFDDKIVASYRNIPTGLEDTEMFGHNNDDTIFPFNLRPTCAVVLDDASSMKDSSVLGDDPDHPTETILELNQPAIAFGSYMFKDVENSGSVLREETTGGKVNPYGISALNLFKLHGRIRDWKKAFYYHNSSYDDVTTEFNHKELGKSYSVNGSDYVCLCLSSKFFAITVNSKQPEQLQYLKEDGNWAPLLYKFIYNGVGNFNDRMNNNEWWYKTAGFTYSWSPFLNDWREGTVNGTTGYWVRMLSVNVNDIIKWVVCSGYVMWDSMAWWDDYVISSSKEPVNADSTGSELTDDEKRWYDTYVPISIEYDKVNKKLVGSFWNFAADVNEYYPFLLPFAKAKLRTNTDNIWSWEAGNLDIVDSSGYNYFNKVASIKAVSPIDSKAVLIDDANPDGIAVMATIKNYQSEEYLFSFQLGA